ncbi:type I-E CRISPR-associated protein Cas6/Cse3/CasE [Streptomyces griseoluteus]|uniref:type I-E CRISPR-associated protein Cas6/Cse3/CasE n=1 Tax=Streptomyces griseoluteus TaxID=29306 RepID=UPI00340CCA47
MQPARLTRMRLNPAHPGVRRDLHDYVGLHKTLMRLAGMPATCPHPRREAGLLFRLETDHPTPVLYVQTTHPPLLDALPVGYGQARTLHLTPHLQTLRAGTRVHYRITASPSARIGHNPPPRHAAPGHPRATPLHRGQLTGLYGPDALTWWQRRALQAGLHLDDVSMQPQPFRCRRDTPTNRHHTLTRFEGTATITDAAALTDAVTAGIGRGQAYGAGLLSVAPATP